MARPKSENSKNSVDNEETNTDNLRHIALSMRPSDDGYNLVVIKYNPKTKEAVVVEDEFISTDRKIAFGEFKMRVVKERFGN